MGTHTPGAPPAEVVDEPRHSSPSLDQECPGIGQLQRGARTDPRTQEKAGVPGSWAWQC